MGVDVNTLDEVTGNASIHAIVSLKKRRDKVELLLALLIYSKVDINLPNRRQMTALHLAIEVHKYCIHVQMVAVIRHINDVTVFAEYILLVQGRMCELT